MINMSHLLRTVLALLLTAIASSLSLPIDEQRERWLEVMGLADKPGIYVGPGPVDMEFSGDFQNGLPGGLQGSGDQPSVQTQEQDFDITDLLIAVDHQNREESFIPSSSSSMMSSSFSSSIVEASVSEYDGIDSEKDVHIEEPDNEMYEGGNELGTGRTDQDGDVVNMPQNPNAIPNAFQNGANAELGPGTDMTVNQVSTRAKAKHDMDHQPHPNKASEGHKSTISGKGNDPPNVLKYTAVIGVVMVAGAVGMGALLSAIGLGAVRLVKRVRKPNVVEA